jgi:hypothetical protein
LSYHTYHFIGKYNCKDYIWCINFIFALIWNILLGYNIMNK